MTNQIKIKDAQAKNYVLSIVSDAAQARLEIDEFLADNDMTNLYLLAMAAMQLEHSEKSAANGNEDWWTFHSLACKSTSSSCIVSDSDQSCYLRSIERAVE